MLRAFTALLLASFSAVILAQAPTPVRVRGTVETLDGPNLTVKGRDGQSRRVQLADKFAVVGVTKASLADVASGKYIGTTTVGERDGALVAEEIHIFPDSMRGTGEGHRDWDLKPNSKMTNAAVADIIALGNDRVMTVKYKGGEKKVLVTPQTVVVAYIPTDKSQLKTGAPVFVPCERQPDGTLRSERVNVGLDGVVPPM